MRAMADDDDTVPTGRAGVDPLIAYPLESTGHTGEIERPGDQTPWWFIPGMFAVGLGFIGLLVFINDRRADQSASNPPAAADVAAEVTEVTIVPETPAPTGAAESSTSEAATSTEATTTIDPRLAELPAPGSVRIGPAEYPVVARC